MIKVKGSSRQRLAALAHSKKEMLERQAILAPEVVYKLETVTEPEAVLPEPVSGKTAQFRQVSINHPVLPVTKIDDVLGDFSEQTGARFG
jgi:hypothetical protein